MPIEIRDYDPSWPRRFAIERDRLRHVLGEVALRIEHVGSTAVPGLAAKAVIDIQVSVEPGHTTEDLRPVLESRGYTYTPRPFPFFHKPARWLHTHHVHVRAAGSRDERRTLAFRDFLREHPADRRAYELLKRCLAPAAEAETLDGRFRYSEAKSDFIQGIERHLLGCRSRAAGAGVTVQESPIQGLGLFASRSFEAGEHIRSMVVVREITGQAPLRADLGERFEHCAYPDGRVVLVGYPDRHFNHSCDPNVYKRFDGDEMQIVARRPVAPGDELTLDYIINTAGGQTWPCRCSAARCRGETVGDFFQLPPEIQSEYLPLLAPWFVQKHETRLAALREGHRAAGRRVG